MSFIPQIIYQDPDFLVVDKPAGLLVHKRLLRPDSVLQTAIGARNDKKNSPVIASVAKQSPRGDRETTLVDWLLKHYPEISNVGDDPQTRPGIVHRLDKDASGLMIVARTQPAFDYFKKQFQERKIKKTYFAVVHGIPKDRRWAEIKTPIGLKEGTIKRTTHIKKAKMVKEAITKYRVIRVIPAPDVARGQAPAGIQKNSLLEIQPLTGRTHQIRVHLASIGHPIVGDRIYGAKKRRLANEEKLLLRAAALEFTDSDGKRLKIETDLPNDFHFQSLDTSYPKDTTYPRH